MADEKPKKTKIDLKARLNKGAGGGGAAPGAVPVPMPMPSGSGMPPPAASLDESGRASAVPASRPSMPAAVPQPRPSGGGIAPPPGMSPGIPLPPFGPAARRPAAEPKATAQAQTIKVEIGEEIHQERRAASRRTAIYAVLAALVGIGIGFVGGGAKERGDRGKAAFEGAALLEKDVKAANDKLKELDEKISAGAKELGEKKYPADLVAALGALNVPFDASNLENKQVGSLPGKVLRSLLGYTSAVQEVNKQKDALKNILGAAQAPISKSWKEEREPMVNFAVLVGGGGKSAELVTVKEPFKFATPNDWPKELTVTKVENNRPTEKKVQRWAKGDPENTAFAVEPKSVAGFSSEAMVGRLSKALYDVREVLEGKKDDPTHETAGLVKDGEDLAQELHKVALNR